MSKSAGIGMVRSRQQLRRPNDMAAAPSGLPVFISSSVAIKVQASIMPGWLNIIL